MSRENKSSEREYYLLRAESSLLCMTCLHLHYAFNCLEYAGLRGKFLDRIEDGKHLRYKLGEVRCVDRHWVDEVCYTTARNILRL